MSTRQSVAKCEDEDDFSMWDNPWSLKEVQAQLEKEEYWLFKKPSVLVNEHTAGSKRCSICHHLKNLHATKETASCGKKTKPSCLDFETCPTGYADGKSSTFSDYLLISYLQVTTRRGSLPRDEGTTTLTGRNFSTSWRRRELPKALRRSPRREWATPRISRPSKHRLRPVANQSSLSQTSTRELLGCPLKSKWILNDYFF